MNNHSDDAPSKRSSPLQAASDDAGEGTRVDLGDDLIEKTRAISGLLPRAAPPDTSPSAPGAATEESLPESELDSQLHSARILFSEGLLEQAKKLLHRILLTDPSYMPARDTLHELHDEELRQLFSDERGRRRFGRRPEPQAEVDADEVLARLDEDLELGLGASGLAGSPGSNDALSLFGDAQAMQRFCEKLDLDLEDVSPQDRVDIGVGFLEMGLYGVASRQFHAACRDLAHQEPGLALVSATGLLAYALLLDRKPVEATICLQPVLNDVELADEHKTELFYLMGRATELLKKPAEAVRWYEKVAQLNPRYRDVQDRLRRKP